MNRLIAGAAACGLAIGSAAFGQCPDPLPYNGGFELEDPWAPGEPEGWQGIAAGAPGWTTDYARTGSYSMGLGVASSGAFTGWTTSKNDNDGIMDACYDPDFYGLFDPPYEYLGGDLVVSGYYMIPSDDPLAPGGVGGPNDDLVGIKLETRRPNWSHYMVFEFPFVDVSTTNDAWVPFEITLEEDQVLPDWPPFPIAVSIVPFRFDGNTDWIGTIYFDDITMVQGAVCIPDINGDGFVNLQDVLDFIDLFSTGQPGADLNDDGFINLGDVLLFIDLFTAGC